MKLISKASHVFNKILDFFAYLGFWVMMWLIVIITTEILTRYFLNKPITWAVEVTEYSILWLTFLSTAWVLRRGGHVVTDVVLSRLSPRTQRILNIYTSVVATCACALFTFYAFKVTIDLYQRGLHMATVIKPLQWIIYLVIPAGSLLLSIQFIRRTYGFVATGGTTKEKLQESEEPPKY